MASLLRGLGVLVLVVGLVTAAVAAWQLAADVRYAEVAAAYARHPDHALFQADYVAAAAWHYGLIAALVSGLLGGLSLGAVLLGLGEVLRRLPR